MPNAQELLKRIVAFKQRHANGHKEAHLEGYLAESVAKIENACRKDYPMGTPYGLAEVFQYVYQQLQKRSLPSAMEKDFLQSFQADFQAFRRNVPLAPAKGMRAVYLNVPLPAAPHPEEQLDPVVQLSAVVMAANNRSLPVYADVNDCLAPQGKALPMNQAIVCVYVPKDKVMEGKDGLRFNGKIDANQVLFAVPRTPVGKFSPALTQRLTSPSFNSRYLADPQQLSSLVSSPASCAKPKNP